MRLRWVLFWAAVVLFTAIASTVIFREVRRRAELGDYIRDRQAKKVQLQDKIDRAAQRVEFLKTPEGQAWMARDELNMALPGEKIYRFDGQGDSSPLPVDGEKAIITN